MYCDCTELPILLLKTNGQSLRLNVKVYAFLSNKDTIRPQSNFELKENNVKIDGSSSSGILNYTSLF